MISILCPSRGRPEVFRRMIGSAFDTASGDIEFVVRLDADDETIEDYPAMPSVRYVLGERKTLSDCWNDCWAEARGDIYMHAGDDITFNTPGWDHLIRVCFPPDRIAFVHGDDLGGKGHVLGTHGFLSREWVEAVGIFAPPYFSSDYTDLWFNEVADAIDSRIYVPEVVTEHHHPGFGKAELDQTHRDRMERHKADDCDAIWLRTAPEREEWAEALRAAMR